MVDGQLESIWSQLHYATRALSPVKLVLKVTLFLLLHCTGVFLCFWGVLTRLIPPGLILNYCTEGGGAIKENYMPFLFSRAQIYGLDDLGVTFHG